MKSIKELSGIELFGYGFIVLIFGVPLLDSINLLPEPEAEVERVEVKNIGEIGALVDCDSQIRKQAKGFNVESGDYGSYAYAFSNKGYGEITMKVTIENVYGASVPYTASCVYSPDSKLERYSLVLGHTW